MKPLGKRPCWNTNLAYAVGLITSDGCLYSRRKTIDFTSKDKDLVETFRACLSLQNKIGRKGSGTQKIKRYYHVQFTNALFYTWLLTVGLMPKKSKILGALKIPNKYFADFLRGDLDGDGYVRTFQDPVYKNSQRLYTVFHSASRNHIEWLQRKIHVLLNIQGFIERTTRQFRLTFAKKESLKLLPYLYHRRNLPYLTRKHKIIESFLTNKS